MVEEEGTEGRIQIIIGAVLLIGLAVGFVVVRDYLKEGELFKPLADTGVSSLQFGNSFINIFYFMAAILILLVVWTIIEGFSKMLKGRNRKE